MTTLSTRLDTLGLATQLGAVRSILDKAQARVTFWGTRLVEIQGSSESYALETLVSRVLEAGRKRCHADDLTLGERLDGMQIEFKLKQFYQQADAEIPHRNFFTRLLVWIREFSFLPYTPRFHLEDDSSYFQAFSPDKFYRQFGGSEQPDRLTSHPASEGEFGPPHRIVAKGVAIRIAAGTGG